MVHSKSPLDGKEDLVLEQGLDLGQQELAVRQESLAVGAQQRVEHVDEEGLVAVVLEQLGTGSPGEEHASVLEECWQHCSWHFSHCCAQVLVEALLVVEHC